MDIQRPDQDLRNPESMCYNSQPANDNWEAQLPLTPNAQDLVVTDLTDAQANKLPCLETNEDKGTSQPYNVSIYFSQTGETDEVNNKLPFYSDLITFLLGPVLY